VTATESFLTWYQQLHAADQQELVAYLQQQLCGQQTPVRAPKFGGRNVGPAPAAGRTCPTCHRPL
jgi:hypothetical protein